MKVIFSWLNEYIEEKLDFKTVCNQLSRIGFSVDDVVNLGVNAEGVIVGEILKIEKHPNADRLSLCEVNTGDKIHRVVCGAKNIAVGQKVPLATVGAKLPGGVLKKAKIRGLESEGMICSASELGLEGYDSSGIMVLDNDVEIGRDIREIFKEDYVFELEITPNLAYCLSHYSLARELSVFFGYTLKEFKVNEYKGLKNDFNIKIETDNCYKYLGVVVKNIKNKETPDYIKTRLKQLGLNPKNNLLVDVSNYVMYEIGQPNHIFDLNNIEGGEIIVRQAKKDEIIKTLDEKDYKLNEDIMVIADSKKPVAVAGVIGGYYSSVNNSTESILIEVANFNPAAVRKAAKYMNIKTDSSYRFERGIDYKIQELCAFRIIDIIKSQNDDIEIESFVVNEHQKINDRFVKIDYDKINRILGTSLSINKMEEVLKKFDPEFKSDELKVPSYRLDITNIWDVAEEVARYIGYDIIESKTTMSVMVSKDDPYYTLRNRLSQIISAFGFSEAYNYDLVSGKDIENTGLKLDEAVRVKNPLSKEFEYLKPSLVIGLLKNLAYNINRGLKSIKLYEFATVFNNKKPYEKRVISGLMAGFVDEIEWWKERENKIDFFYLKTVVNYIMDNFDSMTLRKPENVPYFLIDNMTLDIYFRGNKIGFMGLVADGVLERFDIKEKDVYYFEFDMDKMIENMKFDFINTIRKAKPVSNYQYGIRDLSVVVDEKIEYEQLYNEIKKTPDLIDTRLIDVYKGKNIEEGKRSFTFRFVFSSTEKTFTDEELNSRMIDIYNRLNKKFSAKLR